MEHKNSMSRVERLHREKVTRYSIRKYSFGAASVAVAALFMFLGNGAVSANELSKQDTPSVEAPALNKTQLESYISEIETKLSNGSYDNKTEESVGVLKADLESAKATLVNATTQAQLTEAYNKLVTTVSSKLKNKPVDKKETPAVDTTEGKPTVGKKAENTEKKSESNSIENTGSKDPRNGKEMDKDNALRTETSKTVDNITYTAEFSNDTTKEIYVYNKEEANVEFKINSSTNKVTYAEVTQASNQKFKTVNDTTVTDGYGYNFNKITTETDTPLTVRMTGQPNDFIMSQPDYNKTEDQNFAMGDRYLRIIAKDGSTMSTNSSGANADGYFRIVLKSQTYKYSIKLPESNADKIGISNVDNPTDADITKIKNEIKIKYSDKATTEDARLASHKGEVLADRSSVVKDVAVANGTVTVTYQDDSVDTTPVSSVARTNEAPTVSIPYSDPALDKKDIYIYNGEEVDIDITFNDDSGKIQSAALKRGGNIALRDIGENKQDNEWGLVTTVIKNETTTPATIKITGTVKGVPDNKIPKTESQALPIVSRFATATDLDGKYIENQATKFNAGTNIVSESYKTDPGAFTITLKAQTAKYDIKTPASADKVTVSDANNISNEDFEKIKAKVKIEYSNNNIDMRLADKKGEVVDNQTERIESIEREGNNVVVTYKDGSKDTKALADFVNVAPKVEVPYSNQTEKQVYVYTGENTDLTFKGTDEKEIKDLYLRGPGDLSGNNAAGYGLPTGKVENGEVTGEGSVSEDKTSATIKMTGKTNLAAGKEWTSFIVSKDNDGKLSNTDYRALDVDPNAKEKPGYARFVVKNQTSKYDIATPTEKVAVTDPANVTQDELDKIKEKLQIEYSKRNDDANLAEKKGKAVDAEDAKTKIKSVEKDNAGNLVVTYTDGSKDTRPLSDFVAKNPEVTPVKDPANLTDAEKTKVEEAVKKANPTATKVEVGNDGTTTVTFPDGSTAKLTPEKTAKTADSNGLVDPEVTPVKDPANLTDAEKTKVEEAVKKANPTATKVEVGNDGTTTVTFPDGSTAKLTPEKTAKTADSNGLVDPEVTPVKDPANLTDAEKTKVEEAVKKANPTATKVEVGNDGTTTVTFPDGSTAKLTPEKTAKTADSNGLVDPEVTPVKDPANLTDAEKTKVEEAVKKANPTATKVEVGNDGTTTVTFPDGSTAKLTPEKTAKTADSNGLVDPEVTPVKDPANLTDAEKTKVEEAVKKANPTATKVEVGNDGTTTVTFPDGSTAKLTPEKTAKTADSNGLVDPEVTPVKDPANLTDAEKTKVEEAVKKANPTATKVEVGNDGTTTVTFPDGSTAKLTPEKTAKTADSNGLVDPEVTPVKDPANLTDAEKTKVEEAVKKANPTATKVEVGNDGTTTVTFPDGSTAKLTPEKTAKTADSNGLVDPEVTPVKDPANLTDAEKTKVEEAVKKANPTATKVEVGNDGTTTVTFPDGSTAKLTPEKTAKTADSNGLVDPEVTPVKDPANLTDAEKTKVEEAVKKANPTATKVEVGNDGTTTVTFPDGSTAKLTPEKTAKTADSNGLVDPEVTPVKDPANLTDAEKTKVEEAVKKANPTATKVEVGNDGTTTVTFPDGSTAKLTPEKTAKTADSNGLVDPEVTPVKDPANLTDAEKTKVEEAVKKANPTATKVEVGNDGTTTVTFPDGSTAKLTPEKTAKTADSNGLVDPEVTPVKDPANLTDAEKTKVEEAVKKANPTATKVEVGNDGTTTVTFPDGSTAKLTPEKTAKTADSNGLVDPEVTPVKDPANLTDAEKTKVEEAVKKANPTATKVEVGNDGTTTVTFPDGSTAKLTPEKTAKTADSNGLVDPEVTPVKDPANLTDAEKTKVEEAVKKANPTATKVEVGNDGTTTVTFPDGSTAKLTPEKTAKTADSNGLVDPEVTPVKDPANLTDAEKTKVEEAVKKANPTATKVEVGNDGTTTVTFPDGSTAKLTPEKTAKTADSNGLVDPEVTPVKDPANLTDAEKTKVEEAVKKANPTATKVEVGNDGTTTVTFPDGSTAKLTPEKTAKTADSNGLVDPEVTPVKDPANLTDAEKTKVEEAVKKANPTATKVEVGNDGTTTVTFPDGSTAKLTPEKTAKTADSNGLVDPEVTPVKDPANLTDAEKTKVEEAVKKANPTATKVEVGNDGTTTVTFPDGSTAKLTPEKTAKTADSNGLVDPEVTPVKDPANLTDAEKTKVEEAVKKANPTATKVEVGNDGTTTVTFPDGSTAKLTPEKTAKTADSNGLVDPEVTPVKDPANLTDAEKTKVEEAVKKANPTATKVEVGNDGTTTVTFPDGSTAKLTPEKTAKTADSNGLVDPEVTPVKDPANLTDAEKTKVEEAVKKANPTATKVEVGNDGTTTVTFPDGSTAKLTPEKTAKTADSNGLVDPEVTPVKDPANLTDAEKTKVEEAVKKANPTATKVEVGNDGTTTVTFPDGSTAKLTPEKTAKTADSNGLVDPEVTPVKDPANLTDAEKAKVADEVKKANPTAKDVEVGKDGTATVTFPDGSTAEIPAAKAVEKAKDAEGVKDPEAKTPVKDPANLTDAEKAKVADEVKKSNPTAKDVEVGKDGTATVTFPDGSTAEIPAAKAVEKAKDAEGVKDPEAKTPVKDPANLTDAEKAKVADEVKKSNPTAKDVEVGKDGTATVTFPDGSTAVIPAAKAVEKAKDAEGVKDPEAKTPVKDPANLTDAEKAKVADEVKKSNPTAKDVEVGKDGTATVTFPDGSTAEIPAAKAVEKAKDAEGVKDPEAKTPVKDPANLTDAEKAKVADEVKKSNPTAKDVEVGKDGTATVTFPDGSTAEIPAAKAVEKAKDAEGVKDPEAKTPVKDPANLTDAEKAKVADEVKKSNPTAKDVEVGKDGTATVTFPDGSTAVIPAAKAVEKAKDAEGVKDPEAKTPVKDPANLTDAEKAKVADEVKKANPTAKDVEVGKDGTATVTFPDGSTAEIPAAKAVEKAKDAEGVKDPEAKTPVKDPANLTDAEKAKVADEVKKANPTAKDVEVGKDGTATVTFPDGSTAEIPAAKAVEKAKDAEGVKDPEAKTPVKDPANLTDAEKAKVADEVKKANPTAKDVEVGKDGTATVTFPDGSTTTVTPDKTVKSADSNGAKDPSVTPVKDPANLTDAEKAKVADEVKKANPTAKDVEVGNDGTTTVTFPDGSTTTVTPDKTVKSADSNGAKDPSVTPVKDPANLTDAEKAKVADEVKKSNPTAKGVEVGKDGTVTVTFPDGSTTTVTPDKTVKSADSNGAKDPSVTPVKDPANLTDAEKAKVADEVKKANPTAKDVEVGNDGTTTVTFPDGSTTKVTPDKTVKSADSNGVKDPEATPVKDPANLTDAEKAKVADEVKKSNPTAKDVKVGKDGTATVTFPDGTTTTVTPDKTVKSADSNGVKDPSVTPVKDPANLTDAEKAKVADEVKKSNPTAKDVKVGKDGTATVTFPDGSTAEIPAAKAVEKAKDAEGVKDPEAKTPVKDPANLTDAEKAKVADEVKKSNPTAKDVEVGKDGTATVTFPDGSTTTVTPDKTVKSADSNGAKDPSVTPVKDPANLTDAEKAKVADEVKKANPTAKDVEVGNDGTTTVTFPDGSTTKVTPDKTVKSADSNGVKDPEATPVKDPANLTDAEKAKVADEVKKSNPTAKGVEVGKDGTVTVTFPDGSTTTVTPDKTVKSADSNGAKDPSVTPVKDPANLTDAEKAKVADEVKKANPTAKDVEVGNDGTTTVTFPDGSTTKVTPDKTVKSADSNGVKDPEATPVKDPANLTDAEKAKVADEVKKSNPTAKDVKVGKDGTATVTFPDGTTTTVTPDKTVKSADSNGVKDPEATPVKDPANLTDAEKAKVADEVKKSNPTAKGVEVGKDGTVTVTFPDGSTTTVTPDKTVKSADSNGAKDPSVTPVKDPANLTDAEKAKVADEVKKANPTAKDVEVGNDGTTTVTFPDGSTTKVTPDKTVKSADSNGVKDPEATPVKDPANLTDAEKAKVADEVKKSNPTAKDVKVGKDGTATVTFPDGTTTTVTPDKTVKSADSNGVKDPSVTPVKDPANLTDAEKAKVADEVKKSNPTAKDVKVGKDGTATVTFPDGSTAEIPAAKAVEKAKDAEGVKDPEAKTPVKDPANLTDAEKAKVADEVKKSNPTAKDVEVGKDGTATVTFPDGSTAEIPAAKAVEKAKDAEGVKDPEAKTPVKDPANLTDAEKAKVADEVKKSNPTAKDVEVGKDGTATVTFPDGSTAVIPADKAVAKAKDAEGVQNPSTPATDAGKNTPVAQDQTAKPANKSKDSEGVKAPSATSVKDPSNLTDAEKAKVADEVKKSNPTATDVKVGKDGTTTVTFPDGSTAVIPADKAVAKANDSEGVKDPSATAVKDPSNLTDADKAKAASNASQATSAQANARKGAKELPNTGTADSTVAMVAAAASALLGLGLAGRRRKEDEEA